MLYSSVDEPNEMPGVIYGNRLLITRQFWHKFQSNLHGQLLVNWFLPLYRTLSPSTKGELKHQEKKEQLASLCTLHSQSRVGVGVVVAPLES